MGARAFSTIEVLVAVFVTSIALLGLLGSLGYGVRASRSGEVMSQAINHCTKLIELTRSRNLDFQGNPPPPPATSGVNDSSDAVRRPLNAPPFASDFPADTAFERNIRLERMGASGDYNYDVMKITCTVFWTENGRERSLQFEAFHKSQ